MVVFFSNEQDKTALGEGPCTRDGTHPANRVSALKYDLLRKFIATGTGVLITDLDLVYVQNPFEHLHRARPPSLLKPTFTLPYLNTAPYLAYFI